MAKLQEAQCPYRPFLIREDMWRACLSCPRQHTAGHSSNRFIHPSLKPALCIVQPSIHRYSRQRGEKKDLFKLGFKIKITCCCFHLQQNPVILLSEYLLHAWLHQTFFSIIGLLTVCSAGITARPKVGTREQGGCRAVGLHSAAKRPLWASTQVCPDSKADVVPPSPSSASLL